MKHIKLIHHQIQPVKQSKGEVLRCRFCQSNRFRETVLGPVLLKGKISGGTKQLICDHCGRPVSGG